MDREKAGNSAADLIFTPDKIAGALRSDEDHVHVGSGLHLAVKNAEPMSDEQRIACGHVRLDLVSVDTAMGHVRSEQTDKACMPGGFGWGHYVEPVDAGPFLRTATCPGPDDHAKSAVAKV